MRVFDSAANFSATTSAINKAGDDALGTVRTVGQQPSIAVDEAITTTKNLPSLPLFNGLSVNDVVGFFVPPKKSGLNETIDNLTGINIAKVLSPTGPTIILQQADAALATLALQVTDAAKRCIDQKLLSLANENSIAKAIFDYLFNRTEIVGDTFEKPARDIKKKVNDFLYQKIQIQQVTLLKQQIVEEIQKVCTDMDPTSNKNYTTSPHYITTASEKAGNNATAKIANSIIAPPAPTSQKWSSLI